MISGVNPAVAPWTSLVAPTLTTTKVTQDVETRDIWDTVKPSHIAWGAGLGAIPVVGIASNLFGA